LSFSSHLFINYCEIADNAYPYRSEQVVDLLLLFMPLILRDSELIVFCGFVVLSKTERSVNLPTQWAPRHASLKGKTHAALSGHVSFSLSIHSSLHEV